MSFKRSSTVQTVLTINQECEKVHGVGVGILSVPLFSSTGCVWSWGDGDYGKLGQGGTEVTKTPKVIPGLSEVKKVACGSQFTLALTRDGKVFSW